MKDTPTVSVVIPTYNRARFVKRAVDSVLAQSFQEFEIIIVDDGSTDDTAQVLDKLDDPRIKSIRLAGNSGASVARNEGIRASKAEFIAFLDSDDEWLSTKLQKQLDLIRKSDQVGVVNCGVIVKDDSGNESRRLLKKLQGKVPLTILATGFDCCSMWMIRRSCLKRLKSPFDENLLSGQVSELIFNVGKTTQFDFVPEYLVIYHNHHSVPRNENYDSETKLNSWRIYYEKHRLEIERNPTLCVNFLKKLAVLHLAAKRRVCALKYAIRALRVTPFRVRSWFFVLFILLGPWSLNLARTLKLRIRQSIKSAWFYFKPTR